MPTTTTKQSNLTVNLTTLKAKAKTYIIVFAIIAFISMCIGGIVLFSRLNTVIAHHEAERLEFQYAKEFEIAQLHNRIQSFENEAIRREAFINLGRRIITEHYTSRHVPRHRWLSADVEMPLFLGTVYDMANSDAYPNIDPWLVFAYAQVESDFIRDARNTANANGTIDNGLFQFNSGGTARLAALKMGLTYTANMETDVLMSIRMFFTWYSHLLIEHSLYGEFYTKEQEVKFLALSYNAGTSPRLMHTNYNGQPYDQYLDGFVRSVRNYDYPTKIWTVYQRYYTEYNAVIF